MQKESDTNPMGRTANIEEVCQAIIHLSSQHSRMVTGQIVHVDGGKNLTVRGQHAWYGMHEGTGKAFEVGESSSVLDFFKAKMRGNGNAAPVVMNQNNPDVAAFVEANSTSLWAKKD